MNVSQRLIAAALAVSAVAFSIEADGVVLRVDQVRQRYPWNGLVDIDYTISDASTLGPDDTIEVLMVDKSATPAVTNRAVTFLQQSLPMTDGKHRITWCANDDGVLTRTDHAEFHVKVVHYAVAYMVIDISAGTVENAVYPVYFLNSAPEGGFNADNQYKTDKIVLRRIRPDSYIAGSPANEANRVNSTAEKQHLVYITQPFYIGIFEITQYQYEKVMGSNPSANVGSYRPVENLLYGTIRGNGWPTTQLPDPNSFMGVLLQRCKSKNPDTGVYDVAVTGFDLPTEFQWEYACRAGTTKAFNGTDDFDNSDSVAQVAQLATLGRYSDNQGDGNGDPAYASKHTSVGGCLPNAWGLYDMHGNVWEQCRDWYEQNVDLIPARDPTGAASGSSRVVRGGAHGVGVENCRSAVRGTCPPHWKDGNIGFRLSRTLP